MKVTKTDIDGVFIIAPKIFADERGFFCESFNQREFIKETGINVSFVQDNQSHSVKGVLRGLHYQVKQAQGKLVRVVNGKIFDVVVDLRRDSSTFGKWESFELSESNHHQLWIPPGLAHGFLTLSERADVLYKTTDYYAPQHERTLLWNDSELAITWPLEQLGELQLSAKDKAGMSWNEVSKEVQACC